MSNDYMSAMMRFKEERIQYGLTQKLLSRRAGMAQSALSRAEAGLRRFSFPEIRSLCSAVNIFYVFTGKKADADWRLQAPAASTAEEILCHLCMIQLITSASRSMSRSETFPGIPASPSCERIQAQLEYLHCFPVGSTFGRNVFYSVRNHCGHTQSRMSDILGMDIKKLRELEKGRLLPDSEVIWKMYDCFRVSPAFILKDANALQDELDYVLGLLEENRRKMILQILGTWTKLL